MAFADVPKEVLQDVPIAFAWRIPGPPLIADLSSIIEQSHPQFADRLTFVLLAAFIAHRLCPTHGLFICQSQTFAPMALTVNFLYSVLYFSLRRHHHPLVGHLSSLRQAAISSPPTASALSNCLLLASDEPFWPFMSAWFASEVCISFLHVSLSFPLW